MITINRWDQVRQNLPKLIADRIQAAVDALLLEPGIDHVLIGVLDRANSVEHTLFAGNPELSPLYGEVSIAYAHPGTVHGSPSAGWWINSTYMPNSFMLDKTVIVLKAVSE